MGIPQKRERFFFICSKAELNRPKLELKFNFNTITIKEAIKDMGDLSTDGIKLTELAKKVWGKSKLNQTASAIVGKGKWFSRRKLDPNRVSPTITSKSHSEFSHWYTPYYISSQYIRRLSTFPDDFKSLNSNIGYLAGMSVPPVMMAQISYQLYLQWFKK